ncbi:MAG: hypothetical protein ACRYFX_13115 [Janthinobacterium lividum]
MANDNNKKGRAPQVNIRIKEDERFVAEQVAKAHGLNLSALFRMLVNAEARRLSIPTS